MKKSCVLCSLVFFTVTLSGVVAGCGAPTEMSTYAKYGLSFDHPADMSISEHGLMGTCFPVGDPDDKSGGVIGTREGETVAILWVTSPYGTTLSESDIRELAFEGPCDLTGLANSEGVTIVSREKIVETIKDSYRVFRQEFVAELSGAKSYGGAFGAWYSEGTTRFYQVLVLCSEEDALARFNQYLESFREIPLEAPEATQTPVTTPAKDTAAWHLIQGSSLSDQGHYDEAIEEFTKAIELDPNLAMAYVSRARAYGIMGQYDLSFADSNKAIELDPNLAEAYSNRAGGYFRKGQSDLAISDCNKAIELDPNFAQTYRTRALIYADMGQYDLALADCNKAVELEPNFAQTYLTRALVYAGMGQYDLAIADCKRIIQMSPNPYLVNSAKNLIQEWGQ